MRYYLLALLCSALSTTLSAQYSRAGLPPSVQHLHSSSGREHLRSTHQGVISLEPLASSELRAQAGASSELRPFTFALERKLPSIHIADGAWTEYSDSSRSWRISIVSPSAKRLSLRLEDYQMPEGGALYVYGTDGRVKGAFTSQNNSPERMLQLAPVMGDTITLEYAPPTASQAPSTLPFRIASLQHAYTDPLRTTTAEEEQQRRNYGWVMGEPYFNHRGSSLSTLDCASNVLLYPESNPSARSVVMMITEGNTLSSGVLINNTRSDGTAYILTAAHCINRIYETDDMDEIRHIVRTAVFFFGFESPRPDGNIRASEEKTLSGAELVAYNADADMALLRITGLPTTGADRGRIPAAYLPYFAGWSISSNPSAPYYNIHHPYGTTKRYNLANDTSLSLTNYQVNVSSGTRQWVNKHWYINNWGIGTTAAGSSGSPLFDAEGRVIGALTGGRSTCNNPYADRFYSIAQTWTGQGTPMQNLAPYLDPDNTASGQCPAYDPDRNREVGRASHLYAQKDIAIEHHSTSEFSGVGQALTIPTGSEVYPLGAYLVFASQSALQTNFPKLVLDLSPISGTQVGASVWRRELNTLDFVRYDRNISQFSTAPRTLQSDTIEVFIPIDEALQTQALASGDYLLSLRTHDGSPLTLPMLYAPQRSTNMKLYHGWVQGKDGVWSQRGAQSSSPSYGSYWIDLAYQSNREVNLLPASVGGQDITLYQYQGQIYVRYPYADDLGEVSVYSMAGETMLQHTLRQGENRIDLHSLINSGVYVAHLRSPHRQISIKFIHKAQ